MDFELSELQTELASAVRSFCAGRWPMEVVRAQGASGGRSVDRERWVALAETGVFSLCLSESAGGLGLSLADASVVFEQLGRALVPGPLVATHLAAGVVDGAAEGRVTVGIVEADAPGPHLVEHLDGIDVLLVLDGEGVRRVEPSEVVGVPVVRPLDAWTPMHEVVDLPDGIRIGGPAMADAFREKGCVLTSALLVGLAGASLDLAVDYAKEREQFGRPIGSFQAIKHILADMFARFEVARAAVHSAAVLADQPEVSDPVRARSGAKVLAGEAALLNGKAAIQVHGGMGFTWEVDAHLLLKRAWVLDTHFGSPDEHAVVLAELL